MIEREVTIINKLGLHARAAAKLVSTASAYASEIQIQREGQAVNGKSIMGVMMLAASRGTQLLLRVEGADEDAAINALQTLIASRFGEIE